MNKKLLLILSILMSLSLFTMGCAKSVAAPDNITGTIAGQEITAADIETELKKIGMIYGDISTTSSPYFNFNNGTFFEGRDPAEFSVSVDLGDNQHLCNSDYVLFQLKDKINSINSSKIVFTADSTWFETPPSGTAAGNAYLHVNLESKEFVIPQKLKTIRISLYAHWQ